MADDVTAVIESAMADLTEKETPTADDTASDTSSAGDETPETAVPETSPETAAEATPDADPEKPTAEVADAAEVAQIEKDLIEKTPTIAKGKMPVSRHQAVLTRERNQHAAALSELQQKYERLKVYEAPENDARLKAIDLAENNPPQFVAVLKALPQYKAIFDQMIAEATEAKPAQPDPQDEEPPPNYLDTDGSLAYNAEGLKKLRAYWRKQDQLEVEKKLEDRFKALDDEIRPIREERQTKAELDAAFSRTRPVLEDARANWPDFVKNEAKIREELAKPENRTLSLEGAYRRVVMPTFRVDSARMEAEIRAKVIKEMNDKAKAPRGIRPGLPDVTGDVGDVDETTAIIRETLRSLS